MSEKALLKAFLEYKAFNLRKASLLMTTLAGSGHPTSCLSGADLVAALFFYAMYYDPNNSENPNNDRFILSKGHAAPLLYAAWQQVGVISQEELFTYRKIDSVLEGHPTRRFPYTQVATGALGIGLSIGAGMALSALLHKRSFYTYVLLGDGELAEGSIWEAAELASFYRLHNLVALVDCNRLGQSDESLHGHHVDRYAKKFEAFGWKTEIIDGHDMIQIMSALDKARAHKDQPTAIIAKTFKGHGVEMLENKEHWHGKVVSKADINTALEQLETRFPAAVHYQDNYDWKPQLPAAVSNDGTIQCRDTEIPDVVYKKNDSIATRRAYGNALVAAGRACPAIVSLDGDVKNSTFAELFEAKFPERFFQCFIAEQNMVSMGVGFDRCGDIPFISTFAAFFSRAHDQIRMAAIGTANIRLVGSHAGVSIGADGPSQMGLEDIALMRALPDSIVLYPCDAVSTHQLVGLMVTYNKGISYLRTTRMETPVLYESDERFSIGGCKILRQSANDKVCIIAAGVTVFEALDAYEQLKQQGVMVSVIDLYSIKPIDAQTVIQVGGASGNRIITVEDHYLQGGMGQAVAYELRNTPITLECLAVTKLPRSGEPKQLLAWAGIDATAIVNAVLAKK